MKEETVVLDVKPLRHLLSSNQSSRHSSGIHGLARDLSNLIYPLYLNPPSFYSNKTSQNRVLSNSLDPAMRPIASVKAWLLPILPNSAEISLDTLKWCGKCLGYQPLNGMEMERKALRKIH